MVRFTKSSTHQDLVDASPTPQQIRAATAKIRKNWSPRTRRSRRVDALYLLELVDALHAQSAK